MQSFVALMQKVEGAGTFSVFGKLDPVFPGLIVKGVGEISLPLLQGQAEQIIEQCELAPFGRGEETILDTNVRNVWQIAVDALEFTNPQWEIAIENGCYAIAKQLGLSDCKIKFELYKVLVYTKGSFFQEHRDTEKIPNMFATLVVNLPSTHEGGELIVRHGCESAQYSFAGKARFYPEFAAFYADCYHEVKPITSGYRFSLIYNLAIADRVKQPSLSHQVKIVDQIDASILAWSQNGGDNPVLAYLLDHSYTEQNLAINNLKNNDFAKASILLGSAEKNNCKAFLCLVSYLEESYGDCEYSYSRYARDEELSESSFTEYGISRQEVYAHHFINSHGEKIGVKKLPLDEKALLAEIPLCGGPGREVSISEATGNAGATKELWYHRGAIVMWSEQRDFDIVRKIDIEYAIHYFKNLLQNDLSQEENHTKALTLAHHILDNWSYRKLDELTDNFITLGDVEVLKKQMRNLMKHGLSGMDGPTLVRILDQFSWQAFENDLDAILSAYTNKGNANRALAWLYGLLLAKPRSQESHGCITKWFRLIWKSIQNGDDGKTVLSHSFQILALLGNPQLADELLLSIQSYQKSSSLPSIYAPALINALESCKEKTCDFTILRKIAHDFVKHAEAFYATPPKPPASWMRQGQLPCACAFCTEINKFLPDPERSNLQFEKTLQRNLVHLKSKIMEEALDLDVQIERQATKFKGIVTKNCHSFEQAMKRFTVVEQSIKKVQLWLKGEIMS